jgi:hypothetical protein
MQGLIHPIDDVSLNWTGATVMLLLRVVLQLFTYSPLFAAAELIHFKCTRSYVQAIS